MNMAIDSVEDSLPHELTALSAAATLGDPLLEAELSRIAAGRLAVMRDTDSADPHLERARQLFEELDDLAGQSMVLRTAARVSIVRGDYNQAVVRATRAAEVARAVGRTDLETLGLLTTGEALYELGRWADSVEAYRGGLAVIRENGWTYLEMLPRVHILRGLLRQHRYEDVVREGQQGLAVATGEDPVNEAAISSWIASAAMELSDAETARESCQRFRELVDGFGEEVLRHALEDEFDDCLRAVDVVDEWLRS
jgi:ATP/maltotriose-dependent transcriptional regulator MalT